MKKTFDFDYEYYEYDYTKRNFTNPIDLLQWVKKEGHTLQSYGNLFSKMKNYTVFHGNLVKYSLPFSFRIYDKILLAKLKRLVYALDVIS